MLSPTRIYILAVVVVLLLVGLIFLYLIIRKARRSSAQKEAEAAAGEGGDASKAQPSQLSLHGSSVWLRLSFRRAMRQIRAYGKGALYRIPWYMMVGEAQSGKTTILSSTGLDLLTEEPDEQKAGVKQGINWFFFDQGIVLDVAGDFVLRADGATSNVYSWDALLKLLRRHRSERPLDGIILTIPCADLLGAQNAGPALKVKLEQKADLLYSNLVEARKLLGVNLPVYVLITKCDEMTGFRSLCNEIPDRLDEMLGWSSPYTREIAYRSEWVTEAFQNLYRYLFYLQMEIFAAHDHVINRDELFMLPSELREMRKPLQIYLDQIFRESAYHDAFFLRGIYFCGDSAGGVLPSARALPGNSEPEIDWLLPPPNPSKVLAPELKPTPAGRRLAFLGHLFEQKIFQEDTLARPISRTRLSRNKLVRVAQALSLIIPLIGALGILVTYPGLKAREREFYKFLTREDQDLKEVKAERASGINEERARSREANLFEAMSMMSGKSLASPFIPGSWFSSVSETSGKSISGAYQYVVVDSLRRQLDCRTENLLPRASSTGCSTTLGSFDAQASTPLNCGADLSDNSISTFLERLNELMLNRSRYDRLVRDDSGSLDDLNKLLLYINHAPLPNNFDPQNTLFVRALGTMPERPTLSLNDKSVYDRAACRFEGMVTVIYNESFTDKGVLFGRRGEVAKALALLSRPENTWLATRSFGYNSPFEEMSFPDGLSELNRALTDLYNEKFMSRGTVNQSGTQAGDEPGYAHAVRPIVAWDKNALQQAISFYNDYTNFIENKTYNRTETLDADTKAAALRNVSRRITTLVNQAQISQSPPPPLPGETVQRASIRAEVKNFVDAQDLLAQLLDIYRKLRLGAGLRDKVLNQVISLMGEIDVEFGYGMFYEPQRPDLSWWTLDNPFHSYTLFGVGSTDELETYLAQQRGSIAELARQYAAPLLNFMEGQNVTLRSRSVDWRGILNQLERYDAKQPGNTVGVLEDFIRGMDKVSYTDCSTIMTGSSQPADYFITKRNALRDLLYERCYKLNLDKIALDAKAKSDEERAAEEKRRSDFFKSLKSYTDLECKFNKMLAGNLPFSPLPEAEPFNEATPSDIDEFFKEFKAKRDAAVAALQNNPSYGVTQIKDALDFLDKMGQVQAFFDAFLGKKPPYPIFDVSLTFRVSKGVREIGANQIINWAFTVGTKRIGFQDKDKTASWGYTDPLVLSMRWANDSPILPGSAFPPLSHMSTNGKTVTLSFTNNWSLLLLLLKYQGSPGDFDQREDLEPYTLKIVIPAQANAAVPANVQSAQRDLVTDVLGAKPPQVLAFMRVMLMLPGKKDPVLLPEFPINAPQLRDKNHILIQGEEECNRNERRNNP
ncbi:MAG TPA: type VI secretion system protein [Pyrinomonadaceae bacterium]|nr:type VI secretion system protein [Pyrinomonadaceae bacterium]